MRFEFKPSFERSVKSFPPSEKSDIKEAAVQLIDIARILFRWEGDLIEFVLAGNHDDVKQFLKNI